jgi:hypothetical protein
MVGLLLFFAVVLPLSSSWPDFLGPVRAFFGSIHLLLLDALAAILWAFERAFSFAAKVGYYLNLIVVAFVDAVFDAVTCWRLAIMNLKPKRRESVPRPTTTPASPSRQPDTHNAGGADKATASEDSKGTAEARKAATPNSGSAAPKTNAPTSGDVADQEGRAKNAAPDENL